MPQGAPDPGHHRSAEGSRDGSYVLILSDRAAERRALERAIGLVTACHGAASSNSLPAGRPHMAVIDLETPAVPAADAAILAAAGRSIPRLVLHRNGRAAPVLPPPVRVLPVTTPREAVLAGVFALIEAARQADASAPRVLAVRCERATAVVAELFDSAALGGRLDPAATDQGTELVLDAVSEAGILAWLDIVWRHDAGVYQHTLSVAGYAAAFGSAIGLSRADHHRLAKTALLHDIGKSRIPPEILNKPGRLTAEEARLMRRHPGFGADFLSAQGDVEAAVIDAVRHHHERLDGQGYPDGLAGAAITGLTRLVSICDVFSALTERRPYRTPMGHAAALAVMAEARGHLDPALLRAFVPVVLSPRSAVPG